MSAQEELPIVDLVGIGLNSTDTLIRLPRFPEFGCKIEIISSDVLPGGQVATAAVACQRWGLRTRYVGKIGDDLAGRLQREGLEQEGLEIHLIEVPSCSSQVAFILVDQASGERTILCKRDARLDLLPSELRPDWITRARLLHLDGHPSAPAAAAAQWAREAHVAVTADLDNAYSGVEALLEYVDFMISSHDFPERLTGITDPLESLPEIARRFGCRVTGMTLGRDGVLAWDGDTFHYSPGFRVDAMDTTGAGDLFHAAFAYALLQDQKLADALEFSCAAAALNCTALGARGGIRPIGEIMRFMHEGTRYLPIFRAEELQAGSRRAAARRKTAHHLKAE